MNNISAWDTYKKALLNGEINADTFAELTVNLRKENK